MDQIILQILNGRDKGSAYALIALGLTLIFSILGGGEFLPMGRCSCWAPFAQSRSVAF